MLALVADVALQVVELDLQLEVDALGLGALAPVDDQDEHDDQQQEAPPGRNPCDRLHGEAELLGHVVLHPPHLEPQVVDAHL